MKIKSLFAAALVSSLTFSCSEEISAPVEKLDISESDFVKSDGKADSSVQAIFLNMAFSGTLLSDSRFNVNGQIEDQLLFTIGHLNEHNSIGRLDKIILSNVETAQENGRTRINYDVVLPVAWGKKSNVPSTYEFKIPIDMARSAQDAFTEKYNHDCIDRSAHDVDTSSMWYYYRATARNCELADEDVYTATANVSVSEINTTGKYPEYHKIYEDDVLNIVAIFGKYEDGATTRSDAGISAYNQFVKKMKRELRGMSPTIEPRTKNPGVEHPEVNFEVSLGNGKTMKITTLLVDNVRTAGRDFNDRYEELSRTADLIAYGGHAGLGANIRTLANKGDWIQGQYSIVFMNGCDTYAYVDSALNDAHARVNPDDAKGTKYVDIITNAMPAFFRSMERDTISLIRGLMKYDDPQTFEQMFRGVDSAQVVLVSGEEDNTFVPGGGDNADKDWKGLQESGDLARGANLRFQTPVLAAGVYEFVLSGTGDADLYVKVGSEPTKANYDCRPYKSGSNETCRVELAGAGVIHIMIDGYAKSSFALVGSKLSSGNDNQKSVTKTSTPNMAIPDNDASGAFDNIVIDEPGKIAKALINLNVEHTYRGDLSITLSKGAKTIEVYKGADAQANVIIDSKALDALKGEVLSGEYTLHIVDSAAVDVGKLVSWTLSFEVE